MWTDVLDLNEFYGRPLGQMTVRLLRARLREIWPSLKGETVLGLGYATPFLRPFMEEAGRTLAFMPGPQGVTRWPRKGANHTAFVEEMDLPLPDRSVDKVLLIHALECTDQLRPFLREIWRVMADGGRLICVVPTRAGLWSQLDRSPFYQGHPYTPGQVAGLLRANMFAPLRQGRALYMPPTALAPGAAHGAGGRALRPALARPLRRRLGDRVRASSSTPASPSAPRRRSSPCGPSSGSPPRATPTSPRATRTGKRLRPENDFRIR